MEKITVRLSRNASQTTPSARPEAQNGEQPVKEKQHNVTIKCFRTFSELFRKFPQIAEEDPKMFQLHINKLWLIQH